MANFVLPDEVVIHKDKDIGFYTILVNGETHFECLAPDEVVEIIKELAERGVTMLEDY